MKGLTFEEYGEAVLKADASMKADNGHSFVQILKCRCRWCHRSPKAKGRCRGWFNTFVMQLAGELTGTFGIPEKPKDAKKREGQQ